MLKQRIDTLEARLSRELPQFGAAIRPARLEDIRSRLRTDEALVEFVAYADRGRKYGAFLLQSNGNLQWMDLGDAGPINQPAQDLIAAANDWSVSLILA